MVSEIDSNDVRENLPDNLFELALTSMLIFSPEGRVIRFNREAAKAINQNTILDECSFHDLFVTDPKFDLTDWYKRAETLHDTHWGGVLQIKNQKDTIEWAYVQLNLLQTGTTGNRQILCQFNILPASENPDNRYDNLLHELINNIPDNIFIKDTESRFILANIYVARIMGAESPKGLFGKTDFDFYPKKLASKYRNDELEIIETGKAKLNIIEQVIDKNHDRKWFSTSKIPLKNEKDEIIGIMGIGRDITLLVKEQKALRKAKYEAEKADKLKSAFLANLSHEIRTPLNGILGFSQFLAQHIPTDPKAQKYIDIIIQNGKRLLHLISDIIDISKIDSKQFTITKRLFSLNEMFRQLESSTLEDLKLYEKSHIRLKAELSLPDPQSFIFNDDQRIKQVMHNLLSNAVKFTKKGNISFGYKMFEESIYFYVKDTGIGIKDEDRLSIFELFTQADNTLGRQYEGAGLGLSIARGIIHLLGGKIDVNSSYGKGSEFYFTLPLDKKRPVSAPDKKDSVQIERKKILFLGLPLGLEDLFQADPVMKQTSVDIAQSEKECMNILKLPGYIPDLMICRLQQQETWIEDLIKDSLVNYPELSLILITNNKTNLLLKEFDDDKRVEAIRDPVNSYLMIEKIKLLLHLTD
jgi:PAS domain S-box-containing protein